jgi:hypothetical protein
MSISAGLTKAQLENLDKHEIFKCQFNPNELAISKKNTWNASKPTGGSLPAAHFGGAGARTLTLTLTFDTYDESGEAQSRGLRQTDVSKITAGVMGLMDASETEVVKKKRQPRPPHVLFRFGAWASFPCVITDCSQTFTLFLPNGTPVRATLKLTLQEVPEVTAKEKKKGQNPTSQASGARRLHVVQPGDTIDWIAADEMGDPEAWRQIAEFNNLDDPRRLRRGQVLAIPPEELSAAAARRR